MRRRGFGFIGLLHIVVMSTKRERHIFQSLSHPLKKNEISQEMCGFMCPLQQHQLNALGEVVPCVAC